MKTIKDKGKVYQAGAVYEFSDGDNHWCVGILKAIYQGSDYPYKNQCGDYKHIRVYEASLGTIEEAPVELIDGECYQCTDQLGNERKGFFVAENDRLYCHAGVIVDPSRCTNIKLLTVGEQK